MPVDDLYEAGTAPRLLPALTEANRPYWTGGARGELMVPHCRLCRRWCLPPASQCPTCRGELDWRAVSGRGTVFTYTVNAHQFHPDVPPPTLIAIVQLDEQDDLRLATNLVRCRPDDVHCGLAVTARFEPIGEVYFPVFAPDEARV
jgi:hypothetical protein